METKKMNVFILADNALVVNGLRHYLENKFGEELNIFNFYDCKTCLKNVNENIQFVVLDYILKGKSGLETLKAIKAISPRTEVIMHSSNEDVAASITAYQKGESRIFVKKYEYKLRNQYF